MLQLYLLQILLWNAVGFMSRMTPMSVQTIAWLNHLNYIGLLFNMSYVKITTYYNIS